MGLYDTSWIVYYHGYQIKVIRKGKSQSISELTVNGVIVPNTKVISYMDWATVHTNYYFSNVEREIEVRFATKTGMLDLSMGFQVFIDGEYIGNDKHILYPTLAEATKKIKKGFLYYFLFIRLPPYGLMVAFAYINEIIYLGKESARFKLPLHLYLLPVSLMFLLIFISSCYSWYQDKLILKNLQRFARKWK